MKIRTLWGFEGDASKLGATSGRIRAGETFDNVDDEYGHGLIGNGLAIEVGGGAAPKETKPASAAEKKAEKAEAERLEAEKKAAEQVEADRLAAEKKDQQEAQ